jgi:hypothetical protein
VIIDATHTIENPFLHPFTIQNKRERAQPYGNEKEIDGFF